MRGGSAEFTSAEGGGACRPQKEEARSPSGETDRRTSAAKPSCLGRNTLSYNQRMRSLGFALVLLGTAVGLAAGCGSSTDDGPSGSAGTTAGGSSSSAGTSTGKAGEDAKAGATNAGSSSGGSASAGSSQGGSAVGGVQAGGTGTGGQPDAQAGADNEGGTTGDLVDCDPLKITCKRAAPPCPAGQVPRIDDVGNCYGDCVKIDRCACSTAAQCPDQNQYTCWAKQHCGPFVQ